MTFNHVITKLPFKQWVFENKENRLLLRVSVLIMALSFCLLKYIYPYPNFMPPDSYSYLEAANNNDFINMWPIGYSKFLQMIGIFSRSHITLVVFQYMLLQVSVLYFLFTLRYLLSPNKWLFRVLVIISIVNPLIPHIANFVSSDSLFASLSLIWFSQLLWLLYNANQKLLIAHATILLLAFMVRFTAIYYPLVSTFVLFFSPMSLKRRWLGIGAIVCFLLPFIGRTQYEYYLKTYTIQYSAFGGWQLAANALYGYAYSDTISIAKVPLKFKELHVLVNQHLDSIRNLNKRPDAEIGVYYLWNFKSPLLKYLNKQWPKNIKIKYFKKWAKVAPLYSQYGRWLISQRPWSFIRYYAWPNLINYYGPPSFFMGKYNLGNSTVDPIAVTWFNWNDNKLTGRFNDRNIPTMNMFPNFLAILNPAFVIILLFFFAFKCTTQCTPISKHIIACFTFVWVTNTFFSVLSAPIELRYQIFPCVITIPFCLLLFAKIIESLKSESSLNETNHEKKPTIGENKLAT